MDFELTINDRSDFEIFQNLPEDMALYGKMQINCIRVNGLFGKALFYEYWFGGISFRYSVYDMLLPAFMKARANQKVLELRIALHNQIQGTYQGINSASLPENRFSLSFNSHVQTRAEFL